MPKLISKMPKLISQKAKTHFRGISLECPRLDCAQKKACLKAQENKRDHNNFKCIGFDLRSPVPLKALKELAYRP